MKHSERVQQREAVRRRFEAMGLEVRPEGGGWVVDLPVSGRSFTSPGGSFTTSLIRVAIVGANHVKCLHPLPLFYLPMVNISHCTGPSAVEALIRDAWQTRLANLEASGAWLVGLGCQVEIPADAPVVTIPLAHDAGPTQVASLERGKLILPGCGPLAGIALGRAEDRVFQPESGLDAAVDLEIAVGGRLDELHRIDQRLKSRSRQAAMLAEPPPLIEVRARHHHILLVGPRLHRARPLIESLRLRGYRTTQARSATEAMRAFADRSFALVLCDADLGRSEGLELIPSLRRVDGVEEIPFVLVDEREHSPRRNAARNLGAAGYLCHPVNINKVENGFARLTNDPRRRRFARYPKRLPVRWPGCTTPALTTQIGRGGMHLDSQRDLPIHAIDRYEISLPDLDGSLAVNAEVVYRVTPAGQARTGLGLRFDSFPDENEDRLISFLSELETSSGGAPA